MPRRKPYPYVQIFRGGSPLYLRKPGLPRVVLPGPYVGPEFLVAYYAALAGEPVEFRDWLRKAGLPESLSLHGLRKAAARRLAEAGCTVHEIQAVTGHKTLS